MKVKTKASVKAGGTLQLRATLTPDSGTKTKTVKMPEDFKAAFKELMDTEGWRLEIPLEAGGIAAPPSLRWASRRRRKAVSPPRLRPQSSCFQR